jgi:SAM-dependent methyltransferase
MSDPKALAVYPGAMRAAGAEIALRLLRLIRPFPDRGLVLDVGGGTGTFGAPLLRHFAGARWVVVDMPPLEPVATELAAREGARDRIEFVAFDVRRGLPDEARRYDLIILSQILHLIDAEARSRLIAHAVARLAPEGRIAVLDFFVDSSRDAPIVPWLMAMDWLRYGTMFHDRAGDVAARLIEEGTETPLVRPMGSTGTKLILAARQAPGGPSFDRRGKRISMR